MFKVSIDRILRLSAVNWITLPSITSGLLYLVNDEYGVGGEGWRILLIISFSFAFFLLVVSLFLKRVSPSVIWRMVIFCVVLVIPVLIGVFGVTFAYLLVVERDLRLLLFVLVVAVVFAWCWGVLNGYRRRLKDHRFIEREFSFEERRVVVRQPIKTNVDPGPISGKTLYGRLFRRFGPYLVMGIPLAYPIQSLLSDTGGISAVLLLLAVLGFPLTLHILGRLTCGAYLWIYTVWLLERQHGKPVVFATSD